jgi:cephalosporin-C deacetylase
MAHFDIDPIELERYVPDVKEPETFDDFWEQTLDESRIKQRPLRLSSEVSGVKEWEVFDVRFSGFNGDEIAGWMVKPKTSRGVIVEFNGYGGGRGFPHERLWWAGAGYTWVFMDTRGQGSGWGSGGVTPDPHGSAPQGSGFMTRGIESPDTYYYRRVFTDAVLLTEAVAGLGISEGPLVVAGGSQGGGIALATAALTTAADALLCDVPFLCDFQRAIVLTDEYPYREVADYLSVHRNMHESVLHTLSYIDGVNFAKRASVPALFSTGLMDRVCPPSTVFGAKNHYRGPADIVVYPFNGHEGGGGHHFLAQLTWLEGLGGLF